MVSKNQKVIFGVDEVGRGSLAGPVMACAISASPNLKSQISNCKSTFRISNISIRDSKQLSKKQREAVYSFLKENPQVKWGIGRVGERVIDKINIFEATKLAMVKAVKNLEKKINKKADRILLDGNFAIPIKRKQKSIIKGDEKVFLISLASIVAKVERDRLMVRLHRKYPQYGFARHKGYGTKQHFQAIQQFGTCIIHRRSFRLKRI